MTDIKIKRLSLENFKCHDSLVLDFMGGNASVYGDNATGKTSIYDALTWLLFGKDSQGNGEKNIEIKPLDSSGEVKDHLAVTAVEAVLDVNGEEMALRRTYKEVWSTKRGSSQAVYDGNTSEYYVSGVPCKKNAFQDQVNALVDEDTFRMLTSVSHFASGISWQERRAVLFKLSGVMDDRQIMETDEAFTPLLDSMGRLGLEDYKKKLLAEKKGFVGVKTDIPARISECQKTIEDVQGLDFAGARADVEALNDKLNRISARIVAIEHDNAADQKRLEIGNAQLDLAALENENKAYRAQQTAGNVNVNGLNIRLNTLKSQLKKRIGSCDNERSFIAILDQKIKDARQRWIDMNAETFTGGSCPTCGQNLPAAQLQAAKDKFESVKQKRLADILSTANDYKAQKAQAESRLSVSMDELASIEDAISTLESEIEAAITSAVEPKDMDDYAFRKAAIKERMNTLSGELADMMENSSAVVAELHREKTDIMAQISEKRAVISKESLLDYARQRIDALRADAKTAVEALEAIEKMLSLMDEYSRYKTRFVEDRINGCFRIARFRLFREQANGGVEDRCDVVYEGVPYTSVNNGMKINLGIDIINTLSMAYGVKVPLFVDNAESVTNLEACGSQIIRLVVSENDKELRVNYEN